MRPDGDTHRDPPEHGLQSAAISNAVVHVTREFTGRGPTKSKSYVNRDAVTVVLQETLTLAERNLVAAGHSDHVMTTRRLFQAAMRDDMVAAVERLTDRKVIAFMSDSTVEPDVAVETFVLQSQPRD